jgi:hypothetical protein
MALVWLLAGCPGDDEPCVPGWSEVTPEVARARVVLSAWEHAPGDVLVVGGGLGVAGADALAARWSGGAWSAVPVGARSATLWWVWGAPGAALDVWMVGEHGTVLRWDGGAAVTEVPGAPDVTLFGVWGAAPDDVWIVGGGPSGATPDDVLLHWDGATLAPAAGVPARGAALFKVWGTAANDVWVVGEHGTVLRWNGAAWSDVSPAGMETTNVLTVHGCAANDVWAVGGQTLLHWDGMAWAPAAELVLLAGGNGVHCGAGGVLVVGNGGLKWRLDRGPGGDGMWHDEQFETPWNTDFHGALVGGDGTMWAVGGSFNAPASAGPRKGVIGWHRSCR